jgi:hypothetical protein
VTAVVILLSTVLSGVTALAGVVADAAYNSPSEWGYVVAGWGIVIAAFVIYTVLVLRKGRALSRQVPPEDRRWV